MTTQEKLIMILSQGWQIKIYPRAYPVGEPQGFLPKKRVYTSKEEGEVFNEDPFCIGYYATMGNSTIVDQYSTFEVFIETLYKRVFPEKPVLEV